MPPISCTSKWRIFSVRRAASRTTAKASASSWSSFAPCFRRARNSAVLAAQRLVGQPLQRRLEGAGLAHQTAVAFDEPIVAAAEYAGQRL